MNQIETLEAEADRRREDFALSLRKLRRRLTPLGLADEAMRRLDPQGEALTAAGRSMRRNPLPAIPLLLGLSWLALNAQQPPTKPAKPARLKRRARSLIASQKKDGHDEDDQKTQG